MGEAEDRHHGGEPGRRDEEEAAREGAGGILDRADRVGGREAGEVAEGVDDGDPAGRRGAMTTTSARV